MDAEVNAEQIVDYSFARRYRLRSRQIVQKKYGAKRSETLAIAIISQVTMAGGFFAGEQNFIRRFCAIYDDFFLKSMLRRDKVDDDQTVMALLWSRQPILFDAREGDFFDGLRVFGDEGR